MGKQLQMSRTLTASILSPLATRDGAQTMDCPCTCLVVSWLGLTLISKQERSDLTLISKQERSDQMRAMSALEQRSVMKGQLLAYLLCGLRIQLDEPELDQMIAIVYEMSQSRGVVSSCQWNTEPFISCCIPSSGSPDLMSICRKREVLCSPSSIPVFRAAGFSLI